VAQGWESKAGGQAKLRKGVEFNGLPHASIGTFGSSPERKYLSRRTFRYAGAARGVRPNAAVHGNFYNEVRKELHGKVSIRRPERSRVREFVPRKVCSAKYLDVEVAACWPIGPRDWHGLCFIRVSVEEWDGGLGQLRAGASPRRRSKADVQQMSSRVF
jgi:hypothetical protein